MNDDYKDLAVRLSVPADRDLPPGRQALHREYIMTQIHEDLNKEGRQARGRAKKRRQARLLGGMITAGVAVVAAAAVAVTVLPHREGNPRAPMASGPLRPAQYVPVEAGSTSAVPSALAKVALAAAQQPAVQVTPGQWMYIKSESEFAQETQQKTFDGPWAMGPLTVREDWVGQSPSQGSMFRENGQDTPITEASGGPSGPSIYNPSYAWAQSLPTGPQALLSEIYKETAGNGSVATHGKYFTAFDQIRQLLGRLVMPPQTEATFYRAIALIPGVVYVSDSTDAIGRHGFGIAFTDKTDGERDEMIFSKTTYAYLGERDYQVTTTVNAKKGMLIGLSAVLARGVANTEGGTPTLIGGSAAAVS